MGEYGFYLVNKAKKTVTVTAVKQYKVNRLTHQMKSHSNQTQIPEYCAILFTFPLSLSFIHSFIHSIFVLFCSHSICT